MAPRPKLHKFTTQLPATPCSDQMKDEVFKLAESRNISVAQLQRSALALFLAQNVSLTNKKIGK